MRNFIYIFIALIAGVPTINAKTEKINSTIVNRNNGDRYVFMEGGIEFSVYPDGEFDFVVPQVINGLNINLNAGPVNISYNSGFDYDAYVQYDQYGAVLQIGNVPIYYDNWGRIIQAGDIYLHYSDARLVGIGGLNIFYRGGNFAYVKGYINRYNRNFNPGYYANYLYRPYLDRCLVYTNPYRRFYRPQRYSYRYHREHYRQGYRDGYANAYRDFERPQGQTVRTSGRQGSYVQARRSTEQVVSRTARTTRASRSTASRSTPVSRRENGRNQIVRSSRTTQTATPVRRSSSTNRGTTTNRSIQNTRAQRNTGQSVDHTTSRTRARSSSPATSRTRTVAAPQRNRTRPSTSTQVRRTQNTKSASPSVNRTSRSSRSTTVSRSRGNN